MLHQPDFILYAQHGWADTHHHIAQLAYALATPQTLVITPNLGYLNTWLSIKPLIEKVERSVEETIDRYPNTPIRVLGHSMGGLIWIELLERHPEWWSKIESLVLIASPIGGADLAFILDPLAIGIGIARDLAVNRRTIAQKLAASIPTLVIAGDLDNGSDGTITIGTTKFSCSKFICVTGISHAQLKNHPSLVEIIQDFWKNPTITMPTESNFAAQIIQELQAVPGMMDAHIRDFPRSQSWINLNNGISIHLWKNVLQMEHIFVSDPENKCLYSGFVGWLNQKDLYQTLDKICQQYLYLNN